MSIIFMMGIIFRGIDHQPLPFDRKLWDSEISDANDVTRQRMADGLVHSRTLIGMSKAEIFALLGEPPPTDHFREFDIVYWLGPERGWLGLDSEWLVMRVDENGRVKEAVITHD